MLDTPTRSTVAWHYLSCSWKFFFLRPDQHLGWQNLLCSYSLWQWLCPVFIAQEWQSWSESKLLSPWNICEAGDTGEPCMSGPTALLDNEFHQSYRKHQHMLFSCPKSLTLSLSSYSLNGECLIVHYIWNREQFWHTFCTRHMATSELLHYD